MLYKYYMTQRPAMPGAQPSKGLVDIQEINPNQQTNGVGRAYARLTYDRPLTNAEVSNYELTPDADQLRKNAERYMGMDIKFNPVLNLWDIWDGDDLIGSASTLEEAKSGIDNL